MIPKFRAFLKKHHETKDVRQLILEEGASFACYEPYVVVEGWCDLFTFDDVELMQYTGLKDKNGVEIYGGCVVILEDYFKGTIRAKVVKENGAWGLVGIDRDIVEIVSTNWNDNFLTFALLVREYEHPENQLFNVEVIGDIYQNPELLED